MIVAYRGMIIASHDYQMCYCIRAYEVSLRYRFCTRVNDSKTLLEMVPFREKTYMCIAFSYESVYE